METINNVSLTGARLIRDAVVKKSKNGSGHSFVEFTVAQERKHKKESAHNNEELFSVVYWGERAQAIFPVLKKGQMVAIDGQLTQDSYFDEIGKQRSMVRIRASQVLLIEERKIFPVQEKQEALEPNWNKQGAKL